MAAARSASVRAWAAASPSGTTACTRPQASASSAAIRSFARHRICLVRAGPTRLTRRGMVPQLIESPSDTSGARTCAPRPMTRRSSASASASPPPIANRSIAAMVMASIDSHAAQSRFPAPAAWRRSSIGMSRRRSIAGSARSRPAENPLPAGVVSKMAEISRSRSKLRATPVSSSMARSERALSESPRSNVTTAMRPCLRTETWSWVIGSGPPGSSCRRQRWFRCGRFGENRPIRNESVPDSLARSPRASRGLRRGLHPFYSPEPVPAARVLVRLRRRRPVHPRQFGPTRRACARCALGHRRRPRLLVRTTRFSRLSRARASCRRETGNRRRQARRSVLVMPVRMIGSIGTQTTSPIDATGPPP